MAIGLRPFVIGFAIVLFATFLVIEFVINFISISNPNSDLLGNEYSLNSSVVQINNIMQNFTDTSQNVYGQLADSDPSPTDYLFLIFQGAFYIPWTFLAFTFSGIALISGVLFNDLAQILGQSIAITTGISILVAGLLVTIVLLIVRAIRLGESER